MKKERLFYLDFIRLIAVITILLTHYNALFLYTDPQRFDLMVVSSKVANIYIGDFGVSLFFIISGAALMTVYGNKLDVKKFYKKRFWAIYPMFWLTYIIAFVYRFLTTGYYGQGIPKSSLIYTISGFDGFFAALGPTFYLVGEWFLGCIIIIYLLFPIVRAGILKYPALTIGAIVMLYLLGVFCYVSPFPKSMLPMIRLAEFTYGMVFAHYIKKINWKVALGSAVLVLGNTILCPMIDNNTQTLYIGIASFNVLVYISNYCEFKWLRWVAQLFSKYSYAIFLCHHFIIYRVMERHVLQSLSWKSSHKMFLICCIIIAICSVVLYWWNNLNLKVIDAIKCKILSFKEGR